LRIIFSNYSAKSNEIFVIFIAHVVGVHVV